MQFLDTLSQTSLIDWVMASDYGYPIVLTFHAIGMALVVGLMLILNLRIVGLANAVNLSSLPRFFLFAWIGLAINLVSGTLLFLGNYSAYLENASFLIKISLLIGGCIFTYVLIRGLKKHDLWEHSSNSDAIPNSLKSLSIICICLWLGAITAGRTVGYTLLPF